ncbi:DUF1461 domain-containing protein [Parvibacter caecicola]|uniref:lipoprotein intramolecular transacylase Lit n=1 Tax=Parvibacter caecicola TaxID=747645 RepID=UPI00249B3BB4|nr:DUF1461 domain-containing protein [Parvibacter caecicola]
MARIWEKAVCAAGSALLAVTLLAAGLGACCLPPATEVLAGATESPDDSPYTAEQLARLARAARDYTVDFRFGAPQEALARLDGAIVEAAVAACEDPAKADEWTLRAKEAALRPQQPHNPVAQAQQLAAVSDRYALDADALRHLDDCNRLITGAAPALALCAAGAVAAGAILARRGRQRLLGRMLVAGPAAMAAALAALAAWAAIDFMEFFSVFHGLFFPQGNWTFPIDSLLITMYPTRFWMGMGAVWAATTVVLSILCLGFGIRLNKNRGNDHD